MRLREGSKLFVLRNDGAFGKLNNSKDVVVFEPLTSARSIGSTITRKRARISMFFFLTVLFVFFVRSAQLQIIKNDEYRFLAESNRFRTQRIIPQRGKVFDRNGLVLADNIPSFVLTMTIADLPKDEIERRKLFDEVAQLVGIQPTDLDLLLTQYAYNTTEEVPVKRNISFDRAMFLAVQVKQMSGFNLQASSLRRYPQTTQSLSHILGYTGKITLDELKKWRDQGYGPIDTIGKTGIENSFEKILRGTKGEILTEVNAKGEPLSVASKTEPIVGSDITLTIDSKFQEFVESRLRKTLGSVKSTRGSVVALDPKTGDVLAMVSLPSFDNNLFAQGIDEESYNKYAEDEDLPLFFRAISGEYPSGSTFKPFVAYAALSENIISEKTSYISVGGIRINEWFFPDWKSGGHGVTDVYKAISESINTFFYIIGGGFDDINGLGVQKITEYARRFGFGKQTGIDLPNEAEGFLPSKEWKEEVKGERWYVGDTYHLSIGQGDFLTTPLQMAKATAIIANNGIDITPRVLEKVGDKTIHIKKEPIEELNEYALSIVKKGMRRTVTTGSARSLNDLPISVAGKTGTAQAPGHDKFHSWFTGFVPNDDPDLVLAILVEDGGESTEAAVPLAKEIFYWWSTNK